MALPLIPIAIGLGAASAGAALNAWLTGKSDPWDDKDVFNSRMRDMQTLAVAINEGFSRCKGIQNDHAQLAAWRGVRDGFSAFYKDAGTLVYSGPSDGQIAQAKQYASRLYFWTGEYNRLKCGGALESHQQTDPGRDPVPGPETDWATIVKWSVIGLGGAFAIKTLADLFRDYRPR